MRKPRLSQQAGITGTCEAKTKGTGMPCRRPAGWGTDHPGMGRCKLHGGASLRGAANPAFKHGLGCRYLPPKIDDRVEQPPVTVEDLESGVEEAVGAIHWARELAVGAGAVPPLMVINALLSVLDAELRLKKLTEQADPTPFQAEIITQMAGELMDAVERAGLPEEYRTRLAEELRRGPIANHSGE